MTLGEPTRATSRPSSVFVHERKCFVPGDVRLGSEVGVEHAEGLGGIEREERGHDLCWLVAGRLQKNDFGLKQGTK